MNTLISLIENAAADKTAVVLPESGFAVSYGQLRSQVAEVADILASAGIGPGDRVAMALPNSLDTIVCFLAASIAGTAAPLNPGYRFDEFVFYLEDTNAKVFILPPDADDARRAAAERKVPVLTSTVVAPGRVEITPSSKNRTAGAASPDNIALILHTSGSTGRPKRVPLRHRNLAVSSRNILETYKLTADDVALVAMPLFHVHGLMASTMATLLSGGTIVVPPKFNPLSFWRTVRDNGATWYSAVPTIHNLLLTRAGKDRPDGAQNLRFIRSCSAPLSAEMMNQMESVFGVPVLEAYGMTEASHQMSSNPLPPAERKPGSVGPGTGVKISIMDAEGNHLPKGTAGEIVIQGANVIDGYENNPEANATSFTNGWFRTGDQGILDSDGYLRLVARIKELINRGGEKISPREIDEVLLAHPSVAEAVCFGVPHPTWGEEVAAAIVLKESASDTDIMGYCKEHLAEFKRPKKIHVVQQIPRTATGKIQRKAVAAAIVGENK
jgi:oxalate---CoA ligase